MRWAANERLPNSFSTKGAASILALKENQPVLAEKVSDSFALAPKDIPALTSAWPDMEKSHGRIQRRTAAIISDPAVLAWCKQNNIGQR